MKKIILLVFVHGFKGDDDTFGDFPDHFCAELSNKYPLVTVAKAVYPKYETRGSLTECVSKLRDWLQDKVIDLEVANENHSPTITPSVHVIMIGHSMGGIVAADLLVQLANEKPVTDKVELPDGMETANIMFPKIKGLIAFDTPFWGSLLQQQQQQAEPPATDDPGWWKMGKYAMYAGALGTVAAAGVAAYANRQNISERFGWASSHLEFVGCLAQPRLLEKRLNELAELPDKKIGSVNFFTCLGSGAKELVTDSDSNQGSFARRIIRPTQRTFCSLPPNVAQEFEQKIAALQWVKATNDQASDEILAHTTMFMPNRNPGYKKLLQTACIAAEIFVDTPWYSSPIKKKKLTKTDQSVEDDDFVVLSSA
ncbi:hypothetical protein N7528_001661 [Penicillium herquei]|nr:hypothetical protein N7528_001661 [Penicillium herquei]